VKTAARFFAVTLKTTLLAEYLWTAGCGDAEIRDCLKERILMDLDFKSQQQLFVPDKSTKEHPQTVNVIY